MRVDALSAWPVGLDVPSDARLAIWLMDAAPTDAALHAAAILLAPLGGPLPLPQPGHPSGCVGRR